MSSETPYHRSAVTTEVKASVSKIEPRVVAAILGFHFLSIIIHLS